MSACSDDDDNSSNVVMTAPQINSLVNDAWVLNQPEEGEDPFLYRINWSKARFSYESGGAVYVDEVNYEIEADLFEGDFSSPYILGSTTDLYVDLYTLQINEMMKTLLGKEDNSMHNIKLRIKAGDEGGRSEYSPAISLSITPYIYKEPAVLFDKFIYVIGDMNGWNNSNKEYIMYRNDNDENNGEFTYTGNFGEGCWLKFCAEEFLGSYDNMYCAGENGVLEIGDLGAFFIQGFATVTIDIESMRWSIEAYDASSAKTYDKIGPIGEFCNWDNEPSLNQSAFDNHQWYGTVTFESSTTCKFRGNNDWAENWGGTAVDLPYGKSVFDGPGATVGEPGEYHIYFNDLTGHYVIKK